MPPGQQEQSEGPRLMDARRQRPPAHRGTDVGRGGPRRPRDLQCLDPSGSSAWRRSGRAVASGSGAAPRAPGSIDLVLQEVEAALGPLSSAAEDQRPQEVAPPATGVVVTPCRLAAEMLGPLIAPGSHFLELLVAIDA
jgi:hypothetical protein